MKHRHLINRFQDWNEDRFNEEERRVIEEHLEECVDCRRYYEKMTKLMEGIDKARLPHLEPDPFLPARVRALAAGDSAAGNLAARPHRPNDSAASRGRPRLVFGRLGVSVLAASAVVALALGVFLGTGLSARAAAQAEEAALVDAYYEAFTQTDIDNDWEYVVADDEEESS